MSSTAMPTTGAMPRTRRKADREGLRPLALAAPLLLLLIFSFGAPILALLSRAIYEPTIANTLPRTASALGKDSKDGVPGDETFQALAADLKDAAGAGSINEFAKSLNTRLPGARSQILRLGRATASGQPLDKAAMLKAAPLLGQDRTWVAIKGGLSGFTSFYLLSAFDLRWTDQGSIGAVPPYQAVFMRVIGRTFLIATLVTLGTLILGFPLAYWMNNLRPALAGIVLVLVLLPFWTSILVRVAAWIVLLQSGGLINSALMAMGIIDQPLELVFNRTGVYISMVHILLPFMILPLYSVMKGISPSYMRAAISLGCHPFASFWRVYFPQTYAGVGAGCLLVFILAIGYYITPALLGSPNDQMVSYFVAFYTNTSINWGMATALGGLLLLATVLLYLIYSWLVGASRLRLS